MQILILGNLGYIGPVLTQHLVNNNYKNVTGLDSGFFAHILTEKNIFPEYGLDKQIYKDVRNLTKLDFKNFDVVIYLAAISNDPMGNEFSKVTKEINFSSAITCAKMAKESGVSKFIFASSCSIYGNTNDKIKNENSELDPLTAYAKSKVDSEDALKNLASQNFKITCLRFATACGFSPRLRLDLVLNDFVASAYLNKSIKILSNGSPWRPLIHVKDMARAIEWGMVRSGDNFICVNTGSNEWNYQIKELALSVASVLSNIKIEINKNAPDDNRSYKVDFGKFKKLAPDFQPLVTLEKAIYDIYNGLEINHFNNKDFRNSDLIRLNVLKSHINNYRLNSDLTWTKNEI